MRPIVSLVSITAILALLSGCTAAQVKEAGSNVAAGVLMTVVDIALDGPERRKKERQQRANVPGTQWTPCLRTCELASKAYAKKVYDQKKDRERRAEAAKFQAEFDEFMEELEKAELSSENTKSILLGGEDRDAWLAPTDSASEVRK